MSALVGLLLTLVLPALAGGLLLSGTSTDPDGELRPAPATIVVSRAVACGVATWLIGSGVLARTVGLTATSAWIWDGLVATASLVVLLLPRHRARLRVALGPAGRRLAAIGGLTALVFAPVGVVVVRTSWSPLGSTPWYYYGLARQVAESGSVPATSVEFATRTPFLNDYHLFTTGTAMLLVQHPHGPVTVLIIVTLLSVLLLGLGAVALTSALGVSPSAALLAVPFAIATGIGAIRLQAYRPEGFALGLALLVVALAVDWLRGREFRSLACATLLVAVLSQVHGIAATAAGVMVVAAALALQTRGSRKEQLIRAGIALAVFVVAVVVTGLVFHEASGTSTAGGLVDQGGLADPTWEFYQAARGHLPSLPPSNATLLMGTLRSLYSGARWWVGPALLLAIVGLWRRRQDPQSRLVVAFTVLSLLGLAIVSSVFMFGWHGYVPRRTGGSRLPMEASLVVPTLVAVGLGCLAGEAWPWGGRRCTRTLLRPVSVLLAVVTVTGLISMTGAARYDDGGSLSRHEVAVWRSVPIQNGEVVLANGYTEGFIPDVTPGVGLLDGRAPYTFGELLHRANGLLRGAQAFFTHPARHWAYLAQNDVTWVVVGNPHTYALSTGNTWYVPSSLDALERCAGLRKVVTDPSLTVFRVVDPSATGCSAAGG